MNSNELVSTKKAAEFLGVSVSTIYRMVEQGTLGRQRLLVDKDDLKLKC